MKIEAGTVAAVVTEDLRPTVTPPAGAGAVSWTTPENAVGRCTLEALSDMEATARVGVNITRAWFVTLPDVADTVTQVGDETGA